MERKTTNNKTDVEAGYSNKSNNMQYSVKKTEVGQRYRFSLKKNILYLILLYIVLYTIHISVFKNEKKKEYHYPWKGFKKDYFVDSYESCQTKATIHNSLYLNLKERLSNSVPALNRVKVTKENRCMKYAHNYSYSSHKDIKNSNEEQLTEQPWLKYSIKLAGALGNSVNLFPKIPLEKGSNFNVDRNLSSSLTDLQQSKINSDTFFQRNFGSDMAKRMNPLLQNMLHNNLCKGGKKNNCPTRVLEFGCGVAGNIRHYCGKHNCMRAVCIEASTYFQFVNTMSLPSWFEFLIGDVTNATVYQNLPSKSFDLIYQSWAFMYVSGVKFHIETLLPALYKGLVKDGYYAFEGPVGRENDKGMMAPTPMGRATVISKSNSIENSEFFFDHCRLLVATNHFKLIEDTRYQSGWSMVSDLNTVKSINLKRYEDDPKTAWEKNFKVAKALNWDASVESDCLIQKITDVSEDEFRKDLKSFVVL